MLSQLRNDMKTDMNHIRNDIKSSLADIQREMKTLRAEQTALKKEVSDLRGEVNFLQTASQSYSFEQDLLKKRVDQLSDIPVSERLQSTMRSLESKIETLEQQARQCNVEISNLPEKRNENLPAIIQAIGNVLKSPISLNDIVAVHRVPHAHQQTTRSKNVVLKFSSRQQRDNLLSSFRKAGSLKSDQVGINGTSMSIYINEHITLSKKLLFRKTRAAANKHDYKYVWIRGGTILVRERDSAGSFAIRGDNDLTKIRAKTGVSYRGSMLRPVY